MKFLLFFLFILKPIISENYTFFQTRDTLEEIREIINSKEKGVYLRFGDGDLFVMNGVRSDSHQISSRLLQKELQEAIRLRGNHVLKCLPLHHKDFGGFEEGMFPGNHECPSDTCKETLRLAKRYWKPIDKIYSPVALAFAAIEFQDLCIDFLLFLKKSNPFLLIGNKHIPIHLKNLLFGDNCNFIQTPESNAYQEIDAIEQSCNLLLSKNSDYKVIIISMGISGRALAKRLYNKHDNIFIFDFGSLMDALSEAWKFSPQTQKRAWIELTKFNCNDFLEKLSNNTLQ